MGIYSVINVALRSLASLRPGWMGLWTIFLSSFFMSIMYPTIFALGIGGLGENTKIGASILVMAIIGGAVLTPIMGLVSQHTGNIANAYAVPLFGYVIVACTHSGERTCAPSSTGRKWGDPGGRRALARPASKSWAPHPFRSLSGKDGASFSMPRSP